MRKEGGKKRLFGKEGRSLLPGRKKERTESTKKDNPHSPPKDLLRKGKTSVPQKYTRKGLKAIVE